MASKYYLGDNRYGKRNVRMLRVLRDSKRHEIHEFTILLTGPFDKAYLAADNESVLPTETQKNTFYALSKKYPVDPMEKWSVAIGRDIMERHKHVQKVELEIERQPWQRIEVGGKSHNHAFRKAADGIRFLKSVVPRNGKPVVISGFKDVTVLKTTQSGFEGFIKDIYTTLTDSKDRIMCTNIYCEWTYGLSANFDTIDFNRVFEKVRQITLERFAGDPDTGTYSASVQRTLFQISEAVLDEFPYIESIMFQLPNVHYYGVDFNQFKTNMTNKNEVFFTFDGAHGLIEARIQRKPRARL